MGHLIAREEDIRGMSLTGSLPEDAKHDQELFRKDELSATIHPTRTFGYTTKLSK